MANRTKLTLSARATFLEGLRQGNTITFAARMVGITRQGAYRLRDADPVFRESWDEAVAEGTDVLVQEAKRRAIDGVVKPLLYLGRVVKDDDGNPLDVREYSDKLLELMLKAKLPEVFRDNVAVEHRGKVKHDHRHSGRIDLSKATDQELTILERLAERSAAN